MRISDWSSDVCSSDLLYDLFLDVDRQYSCAYWTDPGHETLEQAQSDKKAHIAAKLLLEPGQRVLDIGCGWGGMALYLNRVADEIGRASGRERVCQYVYISVVAVSLKKKEKTM